MLPVAWCLLDTPPAALVTLITEKMMNVYSSISNSIV